MKTKRFISAAAALAMIFLIMTGCLIDPQMMMRYQQQYGQNNSIFSSAGNGSSAGAQSQIQAMTQANGGETPMIASAEEGKTPCLIDGKYTNKQVTSYQTAIASLCDVNAVMGIENPTREFVGESINEYDGSRFYKLQQTYNGIEVYGKQLVVTTDAYGSTQALTGNYEKLENVATTPRIDVRTAAQAAAQELGSAVTSMPETVIYALNQTPELAYVFEEPSCSIIISAQTGKVIDNISNIYTSNEDNWEIPKVLRDGKYWLEDTKRGIIIKGSLERENSINKNGQIIQSVLDNASPITAPVNGGRWEGDDAEKAIKLYHFLIVANDYYLKKVGIKPFSNQDDTVYGYINDGFDYGNNAYSFTMEQDGKFVAHISIGFNCKINANLIGHEYTHSVERTVSNMFYSNESGAIMEAYSDVFGELLQEYDEGSTDWTNGSRNLNNPSLYGQPSKYKDENYYTGKDDNGGVHHNSTVISHAMYKMHKSGMVTSDELARMMYRSLMYISSGCTFSELYGAIIASAKRMNLSSGAIREINKCFEDANISLKQYDEGNHVSGRVVDASKNPIPNVIISFTPAEGESGDKAVVTTGADGRFSLMIPSGIYKMKLEKGDKIAYFCRKIEIDKVMQVIDINEQTENEFGDIVFNVTEKKDGVIAGKVIDAVTHRPISGATIKIREGADVTSGDYMKSNVIYDSVGNGYADIVCTTDKSGFYNFNTIPLEDDEDVIILVLNENNSIPYGMYTLEVTAEGYEKTYLTVRSSAIYTEEDLESYKNQNIEMKPISTTSETGVCLAALKCVDEGHYTGNMGDACVYRLDDKPFEGFAPYGFRNLTHRNGNVGTEGQIYENGLEVWIARWNFGDDISWAYRTFKLGGKYNTLTGKSSVIKSHNISDYDVTVYFYDGDKLLNSFQMTPLNYKTEFFVDVSGVDELKVMIKDNVKKAGGTSYALYDLFLDNSSCNSTTAYDASLYIPYVEAAIRDTQDYYYDGYGHYVEALPFNYGKLYDITGDGYPELFTIHNKGGYEGVFEVFTQRNGSVERIFEKRYSLRYTDSDNGFLGIVVASGSFGLSSDKILGLSYGLGDAGGYEHNFEVYCITDKRVYLVVSFEIVVEDSEFTSIKKVNPDGSYVNISANEYIELISKMDASANNTEAVFGNTNIYGYYFEEFGDMTTLYDLLIQLKS